MPQDTKRSTANCKVLSETTILCNQFIPVYAQEE